MSDTAALAVFIFGIAVLCGVRWIDAQKREADQPG